MAHTDEDRMKTKFYGGGSTEPRKWGKAEKKRTHGTKLGRGIHYGNYTDDDQNRAGIMRK